MSAVRDDRSHGVFIRMFSSAVIGQMLLSAANFAVGLTLLRTTTDLQYGYYVLVLGAIILLTALQRAFIAPAMIKRLTRLADTARGDLIGGLYREQRRIVLFATAAALVSVVGLYLCSLYDLRMLLLLLASVLALMTALRREYFRMVLLAYQRAHSVLIGDMLYAVIVVAGVLLATDIEQVALKAVLALGLASAAASVLLSFLLRRNAAWNEQGAPGILRRIAPLGTWSTAGSAIHWSFSQGYNYLVVAVIDVAAVAAIAGTRLLMMPVNLLSTGIGSLMLPLTAAWLNQHGAPLVLQRLLRFAFGVSVAAVCYFALLWFMRDWIFAVLLKKQFAQRDELMLLWSLTFMVMVLRDQLVYLPIAMERFRSLAVLSGVSAVLALLFAYMGMLRYGGVGAPLGVLVGETVNLFGILWLSVDEVTRKHGERSADSPAPSPSIIVLKP